MHYRFAYVNKREKNKQNARRLVLNAEIQKALKMLVNTEIIRIRDKEERLKKRICCNLTVFIKKAATIDILVPPANHINP